MKTKVAVILLMLGICVCIIGGHRDLASAGPIQIRFAHFMPGGDYWLNRLAVEIGTRLEKETDGKVSFRYFPANTLVSAPAGYEGTVKGICDIYYFVIGYAPGRFPKTEVLDLPPYLPRGIDATTVSWKLYKKYLENEWKEVKVLSIHTQPPQYVLSKVPIHSLNDLKGLRIRASGVGSKVALALGANPISMPYSEVFEGLQKGILTGILAPFQGTKGTHFTEITKYIVDYPCYAMSFAVIMNLKKYNSLPPDIQKSFDDVGEWFVMRGAEIHDEAQAEGKKYAITKNSVITLSPQESKKWQNAIDSVAEKWAREKEEKGLPGKELVHARYELCKPYLKVR